MSAENSAKTQGSLLMKNKIFRFVEACGLAVLGLSVSACQGVPVLDPHGPIGDETTNLIVISVILGFIVVIPVIIMTILFAVRYRGTNTKATYKPHWEGSLKVEAFIWLFPVAIIVVLSYLTWVKTEQLDPYKPISSDKRPLRVQVVSLDWNWLFIYPDQGVAMVNKLVIPTDTPLALDLTSATVMSSLFIPELGSQMYAMAGMESHLNLLAHRPGTFTGRNMEFSGAGYASMNFPTIAVPDDQFAAWLTQAKTSTSALSADQFEQLDKPQKNYPVTTYSSVEPDLFAHVIDKFAKTRGGQAMAMSGTEDQGASAMPKTKE